MTKTAPERLKLILDGDTGTDDAAAIMLAIFVEKRIEGDRPYRSGASQAAAPIHDALCTPHLVERDAIATADYPVAVERSGANTGRLGHLVIDTLSR